MARIAGIDLPREKRIEVALTYIYGIGPARAAAVLESTGINPDIRVKDLTEEQEGLLRDAVDISQRNFNTLLAGKIDTRNTCHITSAPPINLVSACAWGFRKLP